MFLKLLTRSERFFKRISATVDAFLGRKMIQKRMQQNLQRPSLNARFGRGIVKVDPIEEGNAETYEAELQAERRESMEASVDDQSQEPNYARTKNVFESVKDINLQGEIVGMERYYTSWTHVIYALMRMKLYDFGILHPEVKQALFKHLKKSVQHMDTQRFGNVVFALGQLDYRQIPEDLRLTVLAKFQILLFSPDQTFTEQSMANMMNGIRPILHLLSTSQNQKIHEEVVQKYLMLVKTNKETLRWKDWVMLLQSYVTCYGKGTKHYTIKAIKTLRTKLTTILLQDLEKNRNNKEAFFLQHQINAIEFSLLLRDLSLLDVQYWQLPPSPTLKKSIETLTEYVDYAMQWMDLQGKRRKL